MAQEPEIKKVIELAPVFSILALAYSCTYLYFYYNSFSINIFQYLDISELLLISISKFVISIAILAFFILGPELKPGTKKFTEDSGDSLDAGPVSNFLMFEYVFLISIAVAVLAFFLESSLPFFTVVKKHAIGIVLGFVPLYLSLYYIYKRKEKKQVLTVVMIVFGWFSIVMAALFGYFQQQQRREKPLGNDIVKDGKTIRSTKKYYYVGHTRNYVFFYNDSTKRADIFPASSVSSMTLD